MSLHAMDQEPERIPKKVARRTPIHQNANLSSSGSRFVRRREGLHGITAKSGGDEVGKVPETVEPTDSAKNRTKPSTSEEADSEPQIQRLTTVNTNAHKGRRRRRRSVPTSRSPLSPPRWKRRGEKRKITSFWRPGRR